MNLSNLRQNLFINVLLSLLVLSIELMSDEPDGKSGSLPPPVEMNAEQDHRHMMDQLGIASIRRGANGRDSNAPNAANYDESKANIYPSLPDPLLTHDRRRVDSSEMWLNVRRPEIVELFDREVYGRVPDKVPAVKWEVVSTTEGKHGDISIITKELIGHVDNSSYPHIKVDIQLNLTTPAGLSAPVPVIMQFSGGFFFRPRPAANAGNVQGDQTRRRRFGRRGPDWRNMVLQKGWGYAAINTSSIQADNGGGLTKGIIGLVNQGQPRTPDDWGALRAWAWGASRALDYFDSDPSVDGKQVGLEGHSRWGKATLVAMAYDPRFAVAYVSSSGAGGASLYRRNYGEIIENVAGRGEYHWMAGNFIKYAGPLTWDDLPVDAHELVALCAPRPVFVSSGERGDSWVDAKGMFLAAAHAQPVYELLGAKTMGTNEFPAVETTLTEGEIAFRQHSGGHTDGPNWPTFIQFASKYLKTQIKTPADKPPAAQPSPANAADNPVSRRGNDDFFKLGPDSLRQEGVPHGKVHGPHIVPSEVFAGTQHTYWVYVPAQYDPQTPCSLMIFNDGHAFLDEDGSARATNVIDNLTFRREIPVMIAVFINPGRRPDQPEPSAREWGDRTTNRPTEYNSLDDRYARVIVDELMPKLTAKYNISKAAKDRGIGGCSSGAIAAFTVAWERPDQFSKVLSTVGSFTNIRGGHRYSDIIRENEKKPIRVFFQDGRNDNRGQRRGGQYDETWDWFLQNVRLVEAMTDKGYDVNYSWSIGRHGLKSGGVILPEMMRWLWRDHPVSTDVNDNVERSFHDRAADESTD